MKKRGWILLLAAVLLLAVGCGGSEKILSTEGVPQEVLQSAQYKAALGPTYYSFNLGGAGRGNRDCHCLQLCAADRQRPGAGRGKKDAGRGGRRAAVL